MSLAHQLAVALLPHPSWARTEAMAVIVGRTLVIYLFLVVGLRLVGKRAMGQMNLYDLILISVLANSVQNAMVGDDTTLGGGLAAATTLLLLNRLTTWLMRRYSRLERALAGRARVVAWHGRLLTEQMKREGVTHEAVQAALREHGLTDVSGTRACLLEVDGTISVIPADQPSPGGRRHHIRNVKAQ